MSRDRLSTLLDEYTQLEKQMEDPSIHTDQALVRRVGRRFAELAPLYAAHNELETARADLAAARELAAEDPSFASEVEAVAATLPPLEEKLGEMLIPRDPHDAKDVIVEIKAGEGGQESALFAGDLLRMYTRYAERRGWVVEVIDSQESDLGGVKDVSVAVKTKGVPEGGHGVWSRLKWEGGVHRVQRVPVTESQGRIHTSAAGVLVLPEAEEVDVTVDPNDLRIDVFRSSGPGGQCVNTTDSAVRITHLPTGIVVQCQNERSQLQNKETCFRMLRAKLAELQEQKRQELMGEVKGELKKIEWGSQIRSYVFQPYTLVKDHRTGYEMGNIDDVMDGDLEGFVTAYLQKL